MDSLLRELGVPCKNIFPTSAPNLFAVVVHNSWLKKWLKNREVDDSLNNVDFPIQTGESVPYPWRKIFIRVLSKKVSKVLPLPRYKLSEGSSEPPLTFSQLLQHVAQTNHRNLWKESYKKYCQNNTDGTRESAIVNLMEHDQLLSEVILRLYGCNIIRIKCDSTGKFMEYKEVIPNKYVSKSYETHVNLLSALFALETDTNFFIVYQGHHEYSLLDCLNFSPNLLDMNYSRSLFIIYQLLNVSKALSDRGLSLGMLTLEDIYMNENLWLQIVPGIMNNVHTLDASLIYEHTKSKPLSVVQPKKVEDGWRNVAVQLEKLCMLWVRGHISNLDYLLHLNVLAGRSATDPQAHFIVPWVTDFSSRCGRNWRDLTKSKYRLTKGDRQLDMTYDVPAGPGQVPHHVTDPLSDITFYVYLARRTPKEVLCKYVRHKWVPAEYPASVQRLQEWTPDECVPELYTEPAAFRSIHEDLPDLGVPSWASCVEDFIMKHREALESTYVSENLHHWIDLTFGYKMSGPASVKCKNVNLSLVDGHTEIRKGAAVQLLWAPHPPRAPRNAAPPPAPPRLHWTSASHHRKPIKSNDSSDDQSEGEEESSSLPQHVSRLSVPTNRVRSRHKSSHRTRSLSKSKHDSEASTTNESRASSHSRHYRVQKSELGKGIIYLPKEFNPVAPIQALEALHNFRTKCFFSKAEDAERSKENVATLNLYPMQQELNAPKSENDDNAFTNHMFLASYDQNYLKKFTQDAHLDALKERKNRTFNSRYTTDAAVYKQFVTESRRQDMLVIGCLIVEIFLHKQMRPLRCNFQNFVDRFNCCRTVLKHNFNSLPKCVSYIASVLLNVEHPSLSYSSQLSENTKIDPMKKIAVTDKGLPPPTPAQLLQPLLMQHLIPFPKTFGILYNLLGTLHEYDVTSTELNILNMYECDGTQCQKYQHVDKTKLYFSQRIAEGKIQACATHLDALLSQVDLQSQHDVLDIFLTHYIELLNNKETSVLAAWYLFDTVSKALGPQQSREKLLKHVLNLYEDDDFVVDKLTDIDSGCITASKQKFVKLYHNIFLLQLMVRLGLQCFLDNFTQHLVEGVGGYKDTTPELGSPGHECRNRTMSLKKPRYSDDTVKNALSTNDIFSPDTSYGSERMTPSEKQTEDVKEKDLDSRSENELFHFESDKERLPSRSSRSKSPAESIDSLNAPSEAKSPSPSDVISPQGVSPNHFAKVSSSEEKSSDDKPMSMFTSYLHFAEEEVELRKDSKPDIREGNISRPASIGTEAFPETNSLKISDMSSESLIWLAHRLGPVLTCRYITRNLLKMLTLCYIGKENLATMEGDYEKDEFDAISITNSRVVGDVNAMKVIKCLTAMVAMYGDQLILFQYLPHAGELIASCRRRLSAPLEGGVVAVLQLLKHLLPCLSDAGLMQQLQDTFLSSLLHPALRLLSTTRCALPSGAVARAALTRKWLDALYALAVRVGPEVTRQQLCTPALQRFFLIFDKASGKIENWPNQESETGSESRSTTSEQESTPVAESFLELCRDGSTATWAVRDGRVVRQDKPPDVACSPPAPPPSDNTAQDELLSVFNEELAWQAHTAFAQLIGPEWVQRCLKNPDTVIALVRAHGLNHAMSSPLNIKDHRFQSSLSDEPISLKAGSSKPEVLNDHISSSNSFGSNVTLVGNRIDVSEVASVTSQHDVVAHRADIAAASNRHLRGDWLIYWEHEIGRPEKENRFNLKQIKLQTFVGHTHSVKSICCLDNEHAFMSGSKDKTVRLWSLRNQGDGTASSQCSWSYSGHRKGVLSLAFLEASRLAVSTDSVVHIWDPFVESVVNQLDNIKVPVSIVRTLPGPSTAVVAATTEAALKIIDARTCNYTHDLKVPGAANSFIRCMCAAPGGGWVAAGLAGGHVAVVDIRTGSTRVLARPHDSEVLRLAAVDEHRIVSSGLDQTTVLWNVNDGEIIAHLKGPTEPVHCLSVHHGELVSGTTNNRVGVHASLGPRAAFTSTKLRTDTLKGVLTTMCVLPINRLLLLGSDNGSINLIC